MHGPPSNSPRSAPVDPVQRCIKVLLSISFSLQVQVTTVRIYEAYSYIATVKRIKVSGTTLIAGFDS